MSHTIYAVKFEQTIIHQHVHLRRESQSHAQAHVLMRLYPIDKSFVFYKVKEGRHVRICSILKVISVHSGDDLDLSFTHRSSKISF
jgi:hypothetical protein